MKRNLVKSLSLLKRTLHPPLFRKKILFFLLGSFCFSLAQSPSFSVVERIDSVGLRDYLAVDETTLADLKKQTKQVSPLLLEEWTNQAQKWKETYPSSYPFPKPEKIKLKIIESKLSQEAAQTLALEQNQAESRKFAIAKITNDLGSFFEVMTENEVILEEIKEQQFYLKDYQRWFEKKKKDRPSKPKVSLFKEGFSTREEAEEVLEKFLNS